jgi:hypothetical protein
MADSLSTKEIERLRNASQENYRLAAPLRKLRAETLKIYAGTDFPGLDGDDYADLVNLMRDSAQAKIYSMAANRPRALVLSHDPSLKAWAKKIGRTLDAYSKRIRLERPLQRCALEAFFGLGIAKVAMIESPHVEAGAAPFARRGKPSVVDCSIDHLCWDLEATDFDLCSFIADRYRVRLSEVVENDKFPASVRAELKERGSEPIMAAQTQDWAESISTSNLTETARFEDWIYLADFYIPSRRCIYTFVVDDEFRIIGDKELAHFDWEGKSTGPYSFLSFGRVPGNTKPSSPAQNLRKQHEFINTIYRKTEDEVEDSKIVFTTPSGSEDDAMRIRDAVNLQIVSVNSNQALTPHQFGGPNQASFGVLVHLLDMYGKRSGNLDQKLGLGPSADTAKQEGMIAAASGASEAADNAEFLGFVREIMVELAGVLWRDATTHLPMTLQIPGAGVSVIDDWFPSSVDGSRRGEFEDYEIDIEPYSLAYKPPSQRAEELRMLWNESMPVWQMMAEQGVQPDFGEYYALQSAYRNAPEIRDIFKFNRPAPPRGPAEEQRGSLKPGGPKEYLHRSAGPQGGGGGASDQAMQLMAASAADNRNGNV